MPVITDRDSRPSERRPQHDLKRATASDAHRFGLERELLQLAQNIVQSRRHRNWEFGERLFSEPAWDMLLALYVCESSGSAATCADLIRASGEARSTAARWLAHLESELLVQKSRHPLNGRTDFIELSDRGRESLERYLAGIHSSQD